MLSRARQLALPALLLAALGSFTYTASASATVPGETRVAAQEGEAQVLSDSVVIRNVTSNRCLYVPWQTPDNGAVAKQVDCEPGYNDQRWTVQPAAIGSYSIRNAHNGRCLYVPWQTPGNGAVVKQVDCNDNYADQLWKLETTSNGNRQFRNVNSNRCLWVPWQTPDNGAVVKQIDCNPKYADQQWVI
ncbi:RICIN domain-containing protein [Streptomyces sp. NPDC051183]|uniref:RICIN domain-containing protein n=1 Tax=Streptomyces sp. NPDC051183 TaxID=3155165 RepID=UPI0034420A8C